MSCAPAFVSPLLPNLTLSARKPRHIRHVLCKCSTPPLPTEPTPLEPIQVRGRTFYVKRDDLLSHAGVTASKLRKFHSLFLDGALSDVGYVVSYGGAQSNAMLALARLCSFHDKPFVYITRTVPRRLATTSGNFSAALQTGMHHLQLSNNSFKDGFTDFQPTVVQSAAVAAVSASPQLAHLHGKVPLFIPQGGAWSGAEYGVGVLARELRAQMANLRRAGMLANKRPLVFLPSGTGTTAFFMQKHLADVAKVVTIPVSGDERYLVKQMRWLAESDHIAAQTTDSSIANITAASTISDSGENDGVVPSTAAAAPRLQTANLPDVLRPRLRATFADIRPEKLRLWQELSRSTGGSFEFDLIYAPKAWEEVLFAIEETRLAGNGEDIVYYHSGGLEGNISMLDRFRNEGLL